MNYQEAHAKIWERLEAELDQRPRGTRTSLMKSLGVNEGFLLDLKHERQKFQLDKLLMILDFLDVSVPVFFREVFPEAGPTSTSARGPKQDQVFLGTAIQRFYGDSK